MMPSYQNNSWGDPRVLLLYFWRFQVPLLHHVPNVWYLASLKHLKYTLSPLNFFLKFLSVRWLSPIMKIFFLCGCLDQFPSSHFGLTSSPQMAVAYNLLPGWIDLGFLEVINYEIRSPYLFFVLFPTWNCLFYLHFSISQINQFK